MGGYSSETPAVLDGHGYGYFVRRPRGGNTDGCFYDLVTATRSAPACRRARLARVTPGPIFAASQHARTPLPGPSLATGERAWRPW